MDKHDCLATALESGGLFPIRASPEDVSLGTDVPVREVWTDHLQRHQLCNQRMRPGLFMVPGSGHWDIDASFEFGDAVWVGVECLGGVGEGDVGFVAYVAGCRWGLVVGW